MAGKKRKRNTKKDTHYVDNEKFLHDMIIFKEKYDEWKNRGAESGTRPEPSQYVGECILKIAERIGNRPNFINYTFKEEMISDGIENCIQYMGNFDPTKSKNPFSYFTTIIHYAFIRRIEKEKKQSYIKMRAFESMDQNRSQIEKMKTQGIVDVDSSNPYADYFNLNIALV